MVPEGNVGYLIQCDPTAILLNLSRLRGSIRGNSKALSNWRSRSCGTRRAVVAGKPDR